MGDTATVGNVSEPLPIPTSRQPVEKPSRAGVVSPSIGSVPDYLTLDEAAVLLGVDRDEAYRVVRSGALPGVKAPKRGGWYVDRNEVAAYKAIAQPPTRGPRRQLDLTQAELAGMLADAQHYGAEAAKLQLASDEFTDKRHEVIREMNRRGLSVRTIAGLFDLAPNVIARVLSRI